MVVEQSDKNPFGARGLLETGNGPVILYRLGILEQEGIGDISRLPYSIKVLLEALLRQVDGTIETKIDYSLTRKYAKKGEKKPEEK